MKRPKKSLPAAEPAKDPLPAALQSPVAWGKWFVVADLGGKTWHVRRTGGVWHTQFLSDQRKICDAPHRFESQELAEAAALAGAA